MMPEDAEKSGSGDPIYRHEAPSRAWEAPASYGRNLAAIEAHLAQFLGEVETVYHEILSDRIHLDILQIPATPERPYQVLVTSGVSDLPMQVPEGLEAMNRVELMMALPPTWPLTEAAFEHEVHYWPVRWLKQVGRLPHDHGTWIGWGHTIPNGDPAEPIANTAFIGVMLTPAYWLGPAFHRMESDTGDRVTFYTLVPLYPEEMQLKLKKGAEELEERFEKRGVDFVLDTNRPNVATRRSFFWRNR